MLAALACYREETGGGEGRRERKGKVQEVRSNRVRVYNEDMSLTYLIPLS